MIHIILLSGGSGTRLWPLSNETRSKQFLKVLRDESGNHVSMVQRVFSQINRVEADINITIVTTESQVQLLENQISDEYTLVVEPNRRDTAPAIFLACAHLFTEQKISEEDTVIVMPIDTFAGQEYYDMIPVINEAVVGACADLVLLGASPIYPSEKYGYILPQKKSCANSYEQDKLFQNVDSFIEKPAFSEAQQLIKRGALWNCGVFAFKLKYLLGIIEQYAQPVNYKNVRVRYEALPKTSFDYEVVEQAESIAVVPYAGVWKDLGTWNTLTKEMKDSFAGRVFVDTDSCKNTHIINETGLPLVVAGMKDVVIVATPDGLLVSGKEESAQIKELVAKAAESRPMYEQRQWGEYRVLDSSAYPDGSEAITKELIIKKNSQISYQRHEHRSEVWTVVSGFGEIVIDGEVRRISIGDVVHIPPNIMHGVRAFEELYLIEVQLGSPLVEEDIIREGLYWE